MYIYLWTPEISGATGMSAFVDVDAAVVVVVAAVSHDAVVGHFVRKYLRFAAGLFDQLVESVPQRIPYRQCSTVYDLT